MRGIYVEIVIQADMDELWRRTQDPLLHQQWDLRFSQINYLPRASDAEPQRFLYATRIGFGFDIEGRGESTGTREAATGRRTSALKFWSDDAKSLIREGSGYWQYHPADGGVRFLTWYDYETRFGTLGRIFDRFVFRPLMGWATAWSFDRLRLWLEAGVPPAVSLHMAMVHAVARGAIAFTWAWHGIVPKLLWPHADEVKMMLEAGLPATMVPVAGGVEVVLASIAVAFWNWRPFFLVNAALMMLALAGVALHSADYLWAAFNPVTLNLGMIALSAIGWLASGQLPSATRCLRRPRKETA